MRVGGQACNFLIFVDNERPIICLNVPSNSVSAQINTGEKNEESAGYFDYVLICCGQCIGASARCTCCWCCSCYGCSGRWDYGWYGCRRRGCSRRSRCRVL